MRFSRQTFKLDRHKINPMRRKQQRRTQAAMAFRRPSWLGVGAFGAGVMYFLDPAQGRRRRAIARDRLAATVRRGWRRTGHAGRRVSADAYGLTQKVTHLRPAKREPGNDADLAQRVESEVFRSLGIDKGRINVNVEEGVAVLRGVLDQPEQMRELEAATRRVSGIRDVRSYLHLPNTPPPNIQGQDNVSTG